MVVRPIVRSPAGPAYSYDDRARPRIDIARSGARGQGLEFVERLPDEFRQGPLPRAADPAFERHPEDGDPRLPGQARRPLGDAAFAQRPGERRAERGELDQLTFPQLRVRVDDRLPLPGEVAALLE